MGRIVAIDYGKKRSGIAVTDELQMIASGLTTVDSVKLLPFIKEYASQNEISGFVVGEARQMNYNFSQSEILNEQFVKTLKNTFPEIPVHRIDERFTSLMATRTIREAGMKKTVRQNKGLVDKVSATIILQSYLEMLEYSSDRS